MAAPWRSCCPLFVLGVLALHVSTCTASYEHTCTLDTRSRGPHPAGICGRKLPEMIGLLCGDFGRVIGGRGVSKRNKRSDPESLNKHLGSIFLGKKDAMAYLHKRQASGYGSQGITCECCYNRCGYSELLEYCN